MGEAEEPKQPERPKHPKRVVKLEDDGAPITWRFSLGSRLVAAVYSLGFLALAVGSVPIFLFGGKPDWGGAMLGVTVGIAMAVTAYAVVISERIGIEGPELIVSWVFWTRRMPLELVDDVFAGAYGITVTSRNGPTMSTSIGQVANLDRWRGRVTKGDRIAAVIKHRAALARGEDPGPLVVEGQRGAGNFWMAIWIALVKFGH